VILKNIKKNQLQVNNISIMNIYFTASARATPETKNNYQKIFDAIENLGHKNIDDYRINTNPKKFYASSDDKKSEIYKYALESIKKSNLVILEVSTHSITMGYLIKYALDIKIPVVALYTNKNEPGFAIGIEDENFQLIEYETATIKDTIKKAIKYAGDVGNIRFNMLLSPKQSIFLKEAAEKEGISKATLIRKLLNKYKKESI